MPAAPLSGIQILDLSRILSGPFATMRLADMGAQVIKIEVPETGDDTRQWGPPFVNGESAYFLSVNRNKRSLTLDLKSEEGQQILEKLIVRSDVLFENFRPGTLERLGFPFTRLQALNPRLVYATISGYGHTGPRSQDAAYDVIIQGETGLMEATGFPDGPPTKVGISVADVVAGMNAVEGILLALYERERSGLGQHVDVALFDALLPCFTYQAGRVFEAQGRASAARTKDGPSSAADSFPTRMGNQHPTIAPYESYPTADGHLNVAVGNDVLWLKFKAALGLDALPQFATNAQRVIGRQSLNELLDPLFATRSTAHWLEILSSHGVPAGPIRTLMDAFDDPHTRAREMVVDTTHPTVGPLQMVGIPIKLSRTPGAIRRPPPLLGEHNAEILQELGHESRASSLSIPG